MNIGDVVTLKSGGPQMTIHALNGPNVQTTWFGEGDAVCIGEFPAELVKLVKSEAPKAPKKAK